MTLHGSSPQLNRKCTCHQTCGEIEQRGTDNILDSTHSIPLNVGWMGAKMRIMPVCEPITILSVHNALDDKISKGI